MILQWCGFLTKDNEMNFFIADFQLPTAQGGALTSRFSLVTQIFKVSYAHF
ncbi:hypothetical protein EXN66_Car004148 [Channa argus]|uniref:Uncharacterized protein n=1 Tax=Channa argus TaxID=215402 RepID=A0A6G1PEL5_CHAAH|nr:hypothetical protein EXN66_Car004148 [Channa argus]